MITAHQRLALTRTGIEVGEEWDGCIQLVFGEDVAWLDLNRRVIYPVSYDQELTPDLGAAARIRAALNEALPGFLTRPSDADLRALSGDDEE
jgi:hypothetical protein